MKETKTELLVIGAGSGGVRAARLAAAAGVDVVVAESSELGGTCVNLGCIPKKLFYYASHFSQDMEDARGYGWTEAHAGDFDWQRLVEGKNREISRLNGIYRQLLEQAGARIVQGRARLLGEGRVEVAGQTFRAGRVLLATGSRPVLPDFPGGEHALVSDDIFHLKTLPERILVVGGGYIALEFACIFAGMGRKTHLAYRREPLLRGFDMEIRRHVTEQIAHGGVKVHLNRQITGIKPLPSGGYLAEFNGGEDIEVDLVLAAVGRRPNTESLGLEEAGVATDDKGHVMVNAKWQTSAPDICAIGDLIGTPQLTPLAIAQAEDFHRQWHEGAERRLEYKAIATAIFSQPAVGTVGLTEQEAVEQFKKVLVYSSDFRELKDSLTGRQDRMLVKLVVDQVSDRVLGAHLVGNQAGEIIQGLALGVRHGLTKAQFDDTLAVHPTAAEEFVTLKQAREGRSD